LTDGTQLPVEGVFIEQGAKGVLELALKLGIQLDDEMKYISGQRVNNFISPRNDRYRGLFIYLSRPSLTIGY